MHLLQLNMRLGALAGRKRRVANNVAESLPKEKDEVLCQHSSCLLFFFFLF